MSVVSSTRFGAPARATASMARPIVSFEVTNFGATRRSTGYSGLVTAYTSRYKRVFDFRMRDAGAVPANQRHPLDVVGEQPLTQRPLAHQAGRTDQHHPHVGTLPPPPKGAPVDI